MELIAENLPYVKVKVKGHPYEVCLDSGSGMSLVSRNICLEQAGPLQAGGTHLDIQDTVEIPFCLNQLWILGNDFRHEYKVGMPTITEIDLPWATKVKCRSTKTDTRLLIVTQEDLVCPAYSTRV